MSNPRKLTPEQNAMLLYLYYVKGKTQLHLSIRFGIAKSTVCKWLARG